jgi:hypothetical protein
MNQIFHKLIGSLDTHSKNSFSARKLSAFVVMACVVAAHIKWLSLGNFTQLEMVLTIDYGFISVCLGLTTYEAIKKKEEPKKDIPQQTQQDIREPFTNA